MGWHENFMFLFVRDTDNEHVSFMNESLLVVSILLERTLY
jgi:hypothetical protein